MLIVCNRLVLVGNFHGVIILNNNIIVETHACLGVYKNDVLLELLIKISYETYIKLNQCARGTD